MQQLLESEQNVLVEQPEWNIMRGEQEDSMPPAGKEEHRLPRRRREELHLHRLVEADVVPLKRESHEEIPSLHENQSDDITEAESPGLGCSEFETQQNEEDLLCDPHQHQEEEEGSLSVDQEEAMPRNIEEEQEDNATRFPFSVVLVKSEDDDSLHEDQSDDVTEAESGRFGYFQREIPQLLMSKEDLLAEQQQWNPSLDRDGLMSTNINEGQKQLWTNPEGQQQQQQQQQQHHHRGHDADEEELPFTAVLVKSENDKDTLPSPKCPQRLTDDITGRQRPRFKCSECTKTFGQKGTLNMHMRIHTGEKPYGCSECGIRFGRKGSLVVHMRIHTGEKPYGCPECGNRFREKGNLITHMRIHTGQKPFVCPECDKRFTQKGKLDIHIRSHTGEKPFSCFVCGMSFREKGYLIKHVRVHTGHKPFGCSRCSKTFTQKGDLNKHMRIHTGEKPFSCPECDKKFNQKGDLNKHVRIHEGMKPFCCSACGKTFLHKWYLNGHMRVHSGEAAVRS